MFDGAVIVLSLAPMVASTVANGPSSPWDAISLIITLRIWRVKRIIDGKQNPSTALVLLICLFLCYFIALPYFKFITLFCFLVILSPLALFHFGLFYKAV